MCGIAGFCNLSHAWRDNIEKMNNRMLHRGPDEGGVWSDEDATVVLGHRRLSILDLSDAGKQPMLSHSERFVIAFNGEIYNFAALKETLVSQNKANAFRGHSDTEILLEYVENFGLDAALNAAKGMFAIAVYDRKEKRLSLARDRVGEKPLYYGFFGGGFLFASEIGVIAEHEAFEPQIDREALSLYFRHGYIPAPFSVYENVKKLDAGCILEIRAPFREVSIRKYWDMEEAAATLCNTPFSGTPEEAAERLDELLTESIKLQMVADVPVGAFLSGGVDSTTVVALMQKVSQTPVKTFSIGFGEAPFNEAHYSKKSAEYLGTDHTELYITDDDALNVIPNISQIYGEPFADPSQIPTYLVSKLARSKVTVSLSGDAGDELFGGYSSHRKIAEMWRSIERVPLPLRKLIKGVSLPLDLIPRARLARHYLDAKNPVELYLKESNVVEICDRLVLGTQIPPYKMSEYVPGGFYNDVRDEIMLMDLLVYHPDDILVKVDRSAMAVSLESRIPLLDKDVLEFALSLPTDYKISGGVQKKVLKDVLYKYVPKEMMERPKKGFAIPVTEWCRSGALREWMEDSLSEDRIRREGILDWKAVQKIKKEFLETGADTTKVWDICVFEQWMAAQK